MRCRQQRRSGARRGSGQGTGWVPSTCGGSTGCRVPVQTCVHVFLHAVACNIMHSHVPMQPLKKGRRVTSHSAGRTATKVSCFICMHHAQPDACSDEPCTRGKRGFDSYCACPCSMAPNHTFLHLQCMQEVAGPAPDELAAFRGSLRQSQEQQSQRPVVVGSQTCVSLPAMPLIFEGKSHKLWTVHEANPSDM